MTFLAGNAATYAGPLTVKKALHRVDIPTAPSSHSREDDSLAEHLADSAMRALALVSVTPGHESSANPEPQTATNVLPAGADRFEIKLPPRFPQANWPADNLPTNAGVALGHRLFHEVRLSRNGS